MLKLRKSIFTAETQRSERLIKKVGILLQLPLKSSKLEELRKGDERKVLTALVLRKRTTVGLKWIVERLVMRHSGSVCRLIGGIRNGPGLNKMLKDVEKMLNSED